MDKHTLKESENNINIGTAKEKFFNVCVNNSLFIHKYSICLSFTFFLLLHNYKSISIFLIFRVLVYLTIFKVTILMMIF